jgi:hypothetical protein
VVAHGDLRFKGHSGLENHRVRADEAKTQRLIDDSDFFKML